MSIVIRDEDALRYHANGRHGKIEVVPTKPVATPRDLSLAYTPGVAVPCLAIQEDPSLAAVYTARSNLVAVITNGTAVLGLGNIGPLAAKPVMEGKGVLFKRYADIDVFDIEVAETDPDRFVEVVAALEPTFGGINLEDIKAPDCFMIEEKLRARMSIPVFHDDQHGTAIITAAALVNAAHIQGKQLESMKVVCIGAGAAALTCMKLWVGFGVSKGNVTVIDRHGVVREGREGGIEPYRAVFARGADEPARTLEDAIVGADVVCGLSGGGLLNEDMLRSMADRPIIFALANPDPEIPYDVAKATRPDAIVGTGRSDYPNQVNNVLGFPYIFRGALDVGACTINEEMKMAAARALADLARQEVPDYVRAAYDSESLEFGADYIIPKPLDERAVHTVAPAVARAAIESGAAPADFDLDAYRERLEGKTSPARRVMWQINTIARREPARIVFPEGEEGKILQAAQIAVDTKIAHPMLIGRPSVIEARARERGLSLKGVEIVSAEEPTHLEAYVDAYYERRRRKGLTRALARQALERSRTKYGMMMVSQGHADGLVSGLRSPYPTTIRPALQIIGVREGLRHAAGLYVVLTKKGAKFLADTTINIDPDAETLAEIAILSADLVKDLRIEPRVAMLSFSNFGDAPHPASTKVAEATAIVKSRRPDIMVDGEMQADVALLPDLRQRYAFSELVGEANVLIFPNLDSGNIAYKMLAATGGGEVIGPLVLGMNRPVNVLQQGTSVSTIVHLTSITAASCVRMARESLAPDAEPRAGLSPS